MKRITLLAGILLVFTSSFTQNSNTVNVIIGDLSYLEKYGILPSAEVSENERIQVHLSFVEQLLREKDVAHLNSSQKRNRSKVLDILNDYWKQGVFPINHDYETRRPCFIDSDGNICAVGYLIACTEGRGLAEKINDAHKYDYLMEMNSELVNNWASEYGFSLEECAMIQPAYSPPPVNTNVHHMPLKTEYGIASGVIGGLNMGLTIANLSNRTMHSKRLAYAGMATGTAQIIFGILNVKKQETPNEGINIFPLTLVYKEQNTLSYINIATGTTTLLTSALNLWMNKKWKNNNSSVNLFSYPGINNRMVAGVSFARKL